MPTFRKRTSSTPLRSSANGPADSWPQKPVRISLKYAHYAEESKVPDRSNWKAQRDVTAIQRHVRLMSAHEMPTKALRISQSSRNQKILTDLESDEMASWIANSYFLEHVNDKAFDFAHHVAERNRNALPLADWTAGLAAWQLGNIDTASHHFEAMAHSASLHRWNRASAAYWAARANFVAKKPELVSADLKIAASEPTTFYGLLALRQLGQQPSFDWALPQVTPDDYERALELPPVERAVALGQIGEIEMADQEMRRGHAIAPPDLDAALIALSADYHLPGAQLHVAETSSLPNLYGALYPIPPYRRETASQSTAR